MTNSDWDANAYHRISEPQWAFGLKFLNTVALAGNERAVDAGCGSGRLTAELLKRLPGGKVLAVDQSKAMLEKAEAELKPVFGDRVSFLEADLTQLTLEEPADLIFSTATLHWVLNHDALFASLFGALKPGGVLRAQCGGQGNVERVYRQVRRQMRAPKFAPAFSKWQRPYFFASPEESAVRLERAGFAEVKCFLSLAPSRLPDRLGFREFLEKVVLRAEHGALPEALRAPFFDAIVAACESDGEGYLLDYVRLNMSARRPL